MAELYRYAAFISYSSKDAAFARKLHRALENYGIPTSLGKFDLIGGGGKQNRIYPVFRDREELSAGHLGDQIEANLKASAALIVVCSPNGAASPWVQKEIEFFAGLGRHAKVFAIIPDTAPLVDDSGADCTRACFPSAFRGDALAGDKLEPLAADARKGKDGFRNAWLKIVAGMIGVSPGQLIDRDRRRQRQRRLAIGSAAVAAGFAVLAVVGAAQTLSARADFTVRAMTLTSQSSRLDAAPFAIAASPPRGALVPGTHSDTQEAFGRIGLSVPLAADLGTEDSLTSYGFERFSPNSSFFKFVRRDRTILLFDLNNLHDPPREFGAPIAAGTSETSSAEFSPTGDWIVVNVEDHERRLLTTLHPLARPGDQPYRLGEAIWHEISPNDRWLVYRSRGMQRPVLIDLQTREARAETMDGGFHFSDDSRFLLVKTDRSPAQLWDLTRAPSPRTIGDALVDAYFTTGSRALVTRDSTGEVMLYDLTRAGAPGRSLGRGWESVTASNDFVAVIGGGRTIVHSISDADRVATFAGTARPSIYDVGALAVRQNHETSRAQVLHLNTGAITELGAIEGYRVALNDRYVVTYDMAGNGALYDFGASPITQVSVGALSGPEGFRFLGGDRFLMTIDASGAGVVRDTRDPTRIVQRLGEVSSSMYYGAYFITANYGGRATLWLTDDVARGGYPLGVVGGLESLEVSSDERFVFLLDPDGTGSLVDLTQIPPTPDPSAQTICRLSADNMRPLQSELRSNPRERLGAATIGRPWNPCDWRGLLAIAPNPEHGDGWFEGLRQWLRLVHVRYFGGRDYACAETTSAASAETRARRRDMCGRFASGAAPAGG